MTYTATLLTSSLGAHPTLELPHDERGRPHAFLRTTVDQTTGSVRIWERVTGAEDPSASYAVLCETGPAFPSVPRRSLATIEALAHPIDVRPE